MRTNSLKLLSWLAVPGWAFLLSGCHTLSAPHNDDGSCARDPACVAQTGNPGPANPAGAALFAYADDPSITVGSATQVHVLYGNQPVPWPLVTVTNSDSTVVQCCASGASVGQATLTFTYQDLTASVEIAVTKSSDGASALFLASTAATGVSSWSPDSIQVPVGSLVEFATGTDHDAVFDSVPGAPSDIQALPQGTRVTSLPSRTFATAGTFRFTCTRHGERGVIVVTP